MQLGVDILLDGVMRTLREAVLPAVQGRVARAQLFAVLDVLQNLRDRVESKAALDDAEAESADARPHAGRSRAIGPNAGAALAEGLEAAPEAPPAARAAALRALLVRAFDVLDGAARRGRRARPRRARHASRRARPCATSPC